MSNSHTPGPWFATRLSEYTNADNDWVINAASPHVAGKSQVICRLNGPWSKRNYEANAWLIAAAPDLLEACKAMVALLDQPVFAGLRANNAIAAGDLKQGRKWLESAIAKATNPKEAQ